MSTTPRYVIGTAGHIDHGKTSLVKALTGVDTDRLKEEKERGITIELGFAHLTLPRHGVVGVVDVPGHERFVRTMVAGAVGIDLVVLVVAADEGVMPQTREHLDICGLLSIRRGLVALTKCDLVDDELRELSILDVREALSGTFLADAPIVPCSVKTGAGLNELLAAIASGLDQVPGRDPSGALRLPIDRVFSMKGFGTVVTGTLIAGRVALGDEVLALPGSLTPAKVRGLQVHGQSVPEAVAGQRTALNLAISKDDVQRGATLVRPGTLSPCQLFDVRLRYLLAAPAPLKRRSRVLFHAGTTQRMAQIVLLDRGELLPGDTALAQIHLQEADRLVLLPGDRFILRGFAFTKQHGSTLGGGEVLRVHSPRHRRGSPTLLATLRETEAALMVLEQPSRAKAPAKSAANPVEAAERDLVALAIGQRGVACMPLLELLYLLPLSAKRIEGALERLRSAQRVYRLQGQGEGYCSHAALLLVKERLLALLAAFHKAEPLSPGLAKESLQQQLGPLGGGDGEGVGEGRPVLCHQRLLHKAIEVLCNEGKLVLRRDLVHLPSHDPEKTQAAVALSDLAEKTVALFRQAGLAPPRLEEAAATLKVELGAVKTTVELLLQKGELLRIKDLIFDRATVNTLREKLVSYLQQHREIDAQGFKDLTGQSRKFTIPLLEYFDGEKLTLRIGEVRRLRG